MINNIIMKQIDNDTSLMSYLQERSQNTNISTHTHTQSKAYRWNSAVSRLHSRHLLGKGYSQIISKISEEQERIKKIHRNRKRRFGKKSVFEKGISFTSNNSSTNENTLKQRIADDISNMIIQNLTNFQNKQLNWKSFSLKRNTFKLGSGSKK